jgi:nanoRNase/pAp phosphatase (c-di-AMP/oligoRNAs hydrolase)
MKNLKFESFLERLKGERRIIIQAHDFPDHDAISSAYALAYLLKKKGLNPFITFHGYIDRVSLRNLIDWLEIPIYEPKDLKLQPDDKIIVVDGCIGEKNINDFPGLEVGVIDHHQVKAPDFVWYADVRSHYGSTATILVEYYRHFSLPMPQSIATALLVGLSFDTSNFTRDVGTADLKALLYLQAKANNDMVNKICRNQVEFHELQLFYQMINSLRRKKNAAFAVLPEGCPKNMLGVLGDFLLSVDELDIVVLIARNREKIFISLRSECSKNNVGKIVRRALNEEGIGFGGGHPHMAAGIISNRPQSKNDLGYVYDLIRPALLLN